MRNYVAIFFALLLLAQGMSPLLGQLAKLPALVSHFYAHHDHAHQEHGDHLTFFDFLAQHYGGREHHDDASQDHSNLPFRGADASCIALNILPPSDLPIINLSNAQEFLPKHAFGSNDFCSRLFGQDIFRPPLG